MAAEITSILEGLADGQVGEVLAAEGDNLALGNEKSELILAGVCEGAELDATYLGADGGGQMCDFRRLGEKIGQLGIGAEAVLDVLEGLQGGVLLLSVPSREIMGVL